MLFILFRTLAYASLFVAVVLVWLPAQLLQRIGVTAPASSGATRMVGAIVTLSGAVVALWCVLAFAILGKGTPAPFDPPRRLVVRGPYRYVRNPMYLGAGTALGGAALYFRSLALLGFVLGFFVIAHLFVVVYEEPALTRLFGDEYRAYRARVRRWMPGWERESGRAGGRNGGRV
jgi:protein-S-isoprenylcysteine O-methyltransferase Ste14